MIVHEEKFGEDLYDTHKPYIITYSDSYLKYKEYCDNKHNFRRDLYIKLEREKRREAWRKEKLEQSKLNSNESGQPK